jgi:hypothetical protein
MKTNFLSLIVACFIISCADKKESKIMQNPKITAANIVAEIVKNIKHYPEEKVYSLGYSSSYCFFEVSVNDLPIFKEFKNPGGNSGFEINPCIFKSGKQKVFYKMHPIGEFEEEFFKTLRDNTYLKLDLVSYDLKNQDASDVTYSYYKTPSKTIKISEGYSEEQFIASGKDYYEGNFEIDVTVPYEMHPAFENGKDLRKMNKNELQTKLIDSYQKVWNIYNNKEYDNIARISYDTWKDEFSSKYDTEEFVTEFWTALLGSYKSDTFEMQPIKDYKLEFFADGKLVALMSTNPDFRNRGNTVLWAKVKHEGALRPLYMNRYFYIPEGETEFKVY